MIWPPSKAWTSKCSIEGQYHFVAINYGGKLIERWIILMSVLDSSVVVKVTWPKLVDSRKWVCGWDEDKYSDSSRLINNKATIKIDKDVYPSIDSGLTIPITENVIRPWFGN